ncbi:MAG: phytanoyl-CoA dioxygenase family protein [Iphinoe sp. HA4291-MV1]|jgi:chlorinating enzyme|nr:phytanoyl-CoA dioxygenase family protein [Iphinoe sp. HA4291-MV1]
MVLINRFERRFSLKLAFWYVLAKIKFIHPILPKKLRNLLPTGWNFHMFWTAFKSGGTRIYNDYYCKLKESISYKPKVSVAPEFQFSEEDIKFFYNNGYIGPFDLISSEEAKNLRDHLVNSVVNIPSKIWEYEFQQETGLAAELFPDSEDTNELTEEYKQYILSQVNKTDRHIDDPKLLNLFQQPSIVERSAQLLGPDIILWRSDCFEVPPHAKGTPWHQSSHWLLHNMRESVANPLDREELFQITCWIALTDANREKGCMTLIPGTHKEIYPLKLNRKASDVNTTYRYDKGEIDYPIDQASHKLIEVKAGQFFLFSERVIHGAIPNKTDSSRWAVNCRIAKASTRFFSKKMFEEGHQITYHKVKNVSLDKWKAILLRGTDRFGYNPLLEQSIGDG